MYCKNKHTTKCWNCIRLKDCLNDPEEPTRPPVNSYTHLDYMGCRMLALNAILEGKRHYFDMVKTIGKPAADEKMAAYLCSPEFAKFCSMFDDKSPLAIAEAMTMKIPGDIYSKDRRSTGGKRSGDYSGEYNRKFIRKDPRNQERNSVY